MDGRDPQHQRRVQRSTGAVGDDSSAEQLARMAGDKVDEQQPKDGGPRPEPAQHVRAPPVGRVCADACRARRTPSEAPASPRVLVQRTIKLIALCEQHTPHQQHRQPEGVPEEEHLFGRRSAIASGKRCFL